MTSGCPKSMTYGPCGGVGFDGSCEVDERRCPFVDQVTVSWADQKFRPRIVDLPRVVVDHRPTGDDVLDRQILTSYRDLGVAVLLGDHLDDPASVNRLTAAQRTIETGVTTIATVTGRNRSDDERARLISGFVDAGISAVLCVTGDHPAARFRDREHVDFGSEGTLIAHEARQSGAVVGVVESPAAPPGSRRSFRLRAKQDAGADFAILNHVGSVTDALSFAATVRDDGSNLALFASVPVMTDRRSIEALAQFPGVHIASGVARRIVEAAEPVRVGVGIAGAMARKLLASGHIAGVNLSGIATGLGPEKRSRIVRSVAEELVDL